MAGSGRAGEEPPGRLERWWWSLGPRNQRALVLGLICLGLIAYGPLLVRPLVRAFESSEKVLSLEEERDAVTAEGRDLTWRIDHAGTPEGQRQEGKELDLVPRGERRLNYESGDLDSALEHQAPERTGLGAKVDRARVDATAKTQHLNRVVHRILRDPTTPAAPEEH